MSFSYSFHLSAKGHSLTTTNKVNQVSKHNLRQYKSEAYNNDHIEVLKGSNKSISADLREAYKRIFDDALKDYNQKQKIASRRIDDYLEHVSESRSDVAAEIIIQIGDSDFWKDKSIEERKSMTKIFEAQLNSLEKTMPDFEVISAVVHYDEQSPHMHIVGVPIANDYKNGLERQVAKTKVFTKERLSELQDFMRKEAEVSMQTLPDLFSDMKFEKKEKGRNKDIPKSRLKEYYQACQEIEDTKIQAKEQKAALEDMDSIEEHKEKMEIEKAYQVILERWKLLLESAKTFLKEKHQKVLENYITEEKPLGEVGRKSLEKNYLMQEYTVPMQDGSFEKIIQRNPYPSKAEKKLDELIKFDEIYERVKNDKSQALNFEEIMRMTKEKHKKKKKDHGHEASR